MHIDNQFDIHFASYNRQRNIQFTGSTLNKCYCNEQIKKSLKQVFGLPVFFSIVKVTEVSHLSWPVIWNTTNDKAVAGVRDLCDMTVYPWCWGQIRQVTSWSANAALSENQSSWRDICFVWKQKDRILFSGCGHTQSCHYHQWFAFDELRFCQLIHLSCRLLRRLFKSVWRLDYTG